MDATCTIQDSIHVFSLVHKYVSRILGTYHIRQAFPFYDSKFFCQFQFGESKVNASILKHLTDPYTIRIFDVVKVHKISYGSVQFLCNTA